MALGNLRRDALKSRMKRESWSQPTAVTRSPRHEKCRVTGKIRWRSRARAGEAIVAILRMHRDDRGLHAYRCTHCGGWHLGHSTPEQRRQWAA